MLIPLRLACNGGNSNTEPYIAAYYLLLAHASAVSLYREKYQAKQGGRIGLTLLGWWFKPATQTPEDAAAAARMKEFHIGWFMHPLVYGEYHPVMRKNVRSRLPFLTNEERKRVKGAFDFVRFNHYIVVHVRADMCTVVPVWLLICEQLNYVMIVVLFMAAVCESALLLCVCWLLYVNQQLVTICIKKRYY